MKGFKRGLLCATVCSTMGGTLYAASTIDMVVAIDESGSMAGEHNAFIGAYIENLDNVLNAQNVTVNRYGLGGFGGSSSVVSPDEVGREEGTALYRHFRLSSGGEPIWGSAAEFNLVTPQLQTQGYLEDGYRMIDYVLRNYQFRGNAGASILLITDEDRDLDTGGSPVTGGLPQGRTIYQDGPSADYAHGLANASVMQQLLAQNNIVLHSVVMQQFTDAQGNPAIAIVGADPATGFAFVKDPATGIVTKVQGYGIVPNPMDTTEIDYTQLSLNTGGTVMDIDQLRSVYTDISALNSLSQELAVIVAAISQGQATVVGVDCSVASGPARTLCGALLRASQGNAQLSQLVPSGGSPGVQNSLNRMVPHAFLGARASIIRGTAQYQRTLLGRMVEVGGASHVFKENRSRGEAGGAIGHASMVPIGDTGGGASGDPINEVGIFVRGTYGQSGQSTEDGVNGYSAKTYSIALGADTWLTEQLLIGGSIGYVKTDSDVRGMSGSGSDATSYMLSAYGSYEFAPSWYIEAVGGYGRVSLDTHRYDGMSHLEGDTRADLWNLSIGVAKQFSWDGQTALRPYAQLHYANLAIDGYREKGGIGALAYKSNSIDAVASEIGIAAKRDLANGWAVSGNLAWEHEFSNGSRSIRTAFVADTANNLFRIKGADSQGDYARVALGVSKEIDQHRMVFANAGGVVGDGGYHDYTLELKYRQSF